MSEEERIKELEQLVRDYDAYLLEIAPYSYKDGQRGKTLRARKEVLLSEVEGGEEQS